MKTCRLTHFQIHRQQFDEDEFDDENELEDDEDDEDMPDSDNDSIVIDDDTVETLDITEVMDSDDDK